MLGGRNSTNSSFLEIIKDFINYIKLFFIIIFHFLISLLLKPVNYVNTIIWNNGICRKCNYGRFISDFRPDKFINNQFYCDCCQNRFLSTKSRESISDKEYKIIVRNEKIKKVIK